jgi:hypothetical protein
MITQQQHGSNKITCALLDHPPALRWISKVWQEESMTRNWECSLAESETLRIAADIDRQGYGALTGYISEEEIEPARAFAVAAVDAAGGQYVCFTGPEAFTGTVLSELPQSPAFKNLCRRLYELGAGEPAPEVSFYQIFRCLNGTTGQKHSYRFHYDSYVLTALLPVAIPEAGLRGDLLIIPSTRPIRRMYLTNVLDKILVDNKVAQLIFRSAARRRSPKIVSIRMRPGNMYFFWGYRSIHTNEPCDPDKLRATALFHYGDPHQNSRSRSLIRRVKA